MQRVWIGSGALAGLTAVAMAAFSAHGLDRLGASEMRMLQSAIQMHGWHALALLGTGLWASVGGHPLGGRLADAAGVAFVLGLLLFCGAVYGLTLFGAAVGGIAPVGGTLLMIGWALLAVSAVWRR